MAIHQYGEGLGKFDMLVMDEGHDAPDEVCSAVACEITTRESYQMLGASFPTPETSFAAWQSWAALHVTNATISLEECLEAAKLGTSKTLLADIKAYRSLVRKLETLASAVGPWAVEDSRYGYRFDPLWPSQYAESMLFRGIPHVLIVSATLMPKTLQILGIGYDDYEFKEYPSIFQPAYSPVYYIPTAKIGEKSTAADFEDWHGRIDEIIGPRVDRKGIIHTVSYDRRDKIILASQFAEHMIGHDPRGTRDTVHYFKRTLPPAILVSPSMGTGWDFPDAECRWQIIAKVPFPDRRPLVVRMREKEDPHYGPYLAIQSLVQATGRGRRSATDWCENFVIDNNFQWLYFLYRDHFPTWWRRLFKRPRTVPPPMRVR
jgi:Rad3-related DNA helicase